MAWQEPQYCYPTTASYLDTPVTLSPRNSEWLGF